MLPLTSLRLYNVTDIGHRLLSIPQQGRRAADLPEPSLLGGSGGRGGGNIYALSIPTTQTYWILTGFTIHFGSMRFVKFSSRGDYTGCVYGGTEKGELGGGGGERGGGICR